MALALVGGGTAVEPAAAAIASAAASCSDPKASRSWSVSVWEKSSTCEYDAAAAAVEVAAGGTRADDEEKETAGRGDDVGDDSTDELLERTITPSTMRP